MAWDGGRRRLRGREDLAHPRVEGASLGEGARRRRLLAHPAAPDDVRARLVGRRARDGVDEGEGLEREPDARELFPECLEATDLVTHHRRALEVERVTRRLHLGAQRREGGVVRPLEELLGGAKAREILVLAHRTDAGAKALADLVPDAARGARRQRQEVGLVREEHRLVEPAVAKAEHVVQFAQRVLELDGATEGAVVRAGLVGPGAPDDVEAGRRAARDSHERVVSRVPLHRNVVPRTELLDESQLPQQRRELVRQRFPLECRRFAEDPRALVLGVPCAEVAQESGAERLRFPDVDHLPVRGGHSVDAGHVARVVLDQREHVVDPHLDVLGRRDRPPATTARAHRWHSRSGHQTVWRPASACEDARAAPQRRQGSPARP